MVLCRILANSYGNVLQKKLTGSGIPSLRVNFLTYLGLSVIALAMAWQYNWLAFPGKFWLYALMTGVFGALGNGFLVMALKHGELSVLGPINAYKAVVAMLAGIILLKEIPGIQGLSGIVLIIGGSYLVLDTMPERFSMALLKRRDIQFRIYALIFTALEAVMLKNIILLSSPGTAFVIWCFGGAFFALFLALPERSKAVPVNLKYLGCLIGCLAVMQLATNFVFERMEVSYALSLFQLSMVLNVWLGYRIFHEGNIMKKILGTLIMIVGSLLIIWQ